MIQFHVLINFLPAIAILNFFINNKKFLICLLSLEIITLSLVALLIFNFIIIKIAIFIIIIMILAFGACEARIGISLLVIISRRLGNDKLSVLSIRKC